MYGWQFEKEKRRREKEKKKEREGKNFERKRGFAKLVTAMMNLNNKILRWSPHYSAKRVQETFVKTGGRHMPWRRIKERHNIVTRRGRPGALGSL